ncbi:MAG TPA: hypothetical protein VF053_02825 [Streptosporangiales bacterium]
MRRITTVLAILVLGAGFGVAPAAGAAEPPPPPAAGEHCCTVSQGYVAAVDAALRSGPDVWADQVMARPDGASYDAVKDYLVPLNGGGVASGAPGSGYKGSTDTGAYFLPFTMPDGDTSDVQASTDPTRQHYVLPLSDGGGVMADYHVPCGGEPGNALPGYVTRCPNFREAKFFVGADGSERFGSAQQRAPLPRLSGGYLPILDVDYTDAQGVRYAEQVFAARVPQTSSLVAYTRITATAPDGGPRSTVLRTHLDDPASPSFQLSGNAVTADGRTYLVAGGDPKLSGADLSWSLDLAHGPRSVVLAMLVTPDAVTAPASMTTDGAYAAARESVRTYWNRALGAGAGVSVPEPYVMDAMRNMLIQQLVEGWRTSVGNGYEDGYVPEDTDAITTLGEFGFGADYKANLQVLLDTKRGTDRYVSWANGTKLEGLARYYEMTGDASTVRADLPLVRDILASFAASSASDPHGLLAPDACCEDNGEHAYWFHGQAVAWRGMTDVLPVLRAVGEGDLADRYAPAAERFGTSLRAAIAASQVRLADGTLFVPERLLSGDQPYDRITATRAGSYWNLLVPYGLASGVLSADQLRDALAYIHGHGGTLLGQTRFNWQGEPVGQCDPNNLPGYYGEGADELYGWQYARALANAGEPDRLNVMFYGKLAHMTTRNTFVSGEGSDIDACPWQYYRQTWWSPMSTSTSVFLNALRQQLLHESVDDHGAVTALTLAPATPRGWLADGKTISVDRLPSRVGPVSYTLRSDLGHGVVRGDVVLPAERPGTRTTLRLATPGQQEITAVLIDGRPVSAFDPAKGTVELTGRSGRLHLEVRYG